MNNINSLICLAILFFISCKPGLVQYKISDKDTGANIVFVMPDNNYGKERNNVIVEKGFGVISESEMKNDFTFKSIESGAEIKIINIGKEREANLHDRYIFRLGKGSMPSKCSYNDMNFVTFFVGNRVEFEEWSKKYKDEFAFFDSTGKDWCKYYKNSLERQMGVRKKK